MHTFDPTKPSARDASPNEPASDCRSPVVLVVSADRELRAYLIRSLRALGEGLGSTLEAADGRAALERAQRQKVDLVITDLVLPGVDGLELARRLAARRPRPRVLVMSSQAANYQGQDHRGRARGVAGWLEKPFDQRMLCGCVGSLLVSKKDR